MESVIEFFANTAIGAILTFAAVAVIGLFVSALVEGS